MTAGEPMHWARNWRYVVPIGAVAIGVSVLLIFPAPVVFPAVVAWWLHLDLSESNDDRPGTLGIIALVVFALMACLVAVVAITFDSHFECGGTFGGFGESASANLDEGCFAKRGWRPVLGAVAMLAVTLVAGIRIRRGTSTAIASASANAAQTQRGLPRALTTIAGLMAVMVGVVTLLVLT